MAFKETPRAQLIPGTVDSYQHPNFPHRRFNSAELRQMGIPIAPVEVRPPMEGVAKPVRQRQRR